MPCTLSTQKRARPAQATAAAMPDWSSLTPDLVRRVGDCFLAADDLDYYMDFRAVCGSWRGATAGPKMAANSGRFQPCKWALLSRHDDLVTFVNVDTGRFLRKSIPLLRKYFFAGATAGGLILLGELVDPYQARVLNPFTGSITRFEVTIPVGGVRAVAVTTAPMTVFVSGEVGDIMWADQNSEDFNYFWPIYANRPTSMASFAGVVYVADRHGSILSATFADVAAGSAQTATMDTTIPSPNTSHPASVKSHSSRYYLVESAGELLLVTKPLHVIPDQPVVRRVDTVRKVLEPMSSIGNRAIFVSHVRCLSVDADKFQTVESGCIYFVDPIVGRGGYERPIIMHIFHVADGAQEIMLDQGTEGGSCSGPFTLAQVFADYCRFIHNYELWTKIYGEWYFSSDDSESDYEGSSESDE